MIPLLALTSAWMPAFEVPLPMQGAIPDYSPDQALPTGTPDPTATSSMPTGEIYGSISNGTSGGDVPVGLPVTLYGIDGNQLALELTSEAGEEGRYSFDGVELTEGREYVVAAEYQGVLYYTEAVIMPEASLELEIPLTIFDITQDPGQVKLDQLHVLFEFTAPGTVSVLEVWVISNAGDATYWPDDGGFEIFLPEGASALRFQDGMIGDRYMLTETGFTDSAPVKPGAGSAQLLFSFDLPYDRRLDFEQPMSFDTLAVDVLIPEGGPEIREGDLTDVGTRQVSTGPLHTYSTGPIPAGDVLGFRISGRAAGAAGGANITPQIGLVIGGIVLGIALIGFGFWWYRAGGRRPDIEAGDAQQDVLKEIAALDDEHAEGKISDAAYRKRRDELKQRALEIMQDEHD
jgi:hypothetical protein